MAEVSGDIRTALGTAELTETDERKARILDAMRDAEMCVLQRFGRDKNSFRSSDSILEDVWDNTWKLHSELMGLRSSVVCMEEIIRRHELRARGHKR